MVSGPLPPIELAERVGGLVVDRGDHDAYLQFGAIARQRIESLLPADWTWDGKRLLDFGCGAGRTLRHFLPEAGRVELWGCDVDEPSIRWLRENLSPPINAFVNGEAPPLPQPDRFFDVICAISVFTHITDQWSAWLLELHRVLADDGIVIATILAEGMSQRIAGEPWDPDRVGMNVMTAGEDWDRGGPNVFLSPWWIRAHWGRAFEILMLDPGVKAGVQGIVAMRRKPVTLRREDLERPEPGEPREEAALRHQVRQLFKESATLRRYANEVTRLLEHERPARAAAEHERDGLRHQLAAAAHESDELRRRLAAAAQERDGAHRQLEETQ